MTAPWDALELGGPLLAVADDFLNDPEAVREQMLALRFNRPCAVNYPGLAATLPAELMPDPARVAALLGGREVTLMPAVCEARLTQEQDEQDRRSLVHADIAEFTAVIHLSEDQTDGIYFYRHRKLGVERVSPSDPWLVYVRSIVVQDTCALPAWEVTRQIPMRFNRLVLFHGHFFHSGPNRLTGTCARTGRLTQNLFYNRHGAGTSDASL